MSEPRRPTKRALPWRGLLVILTWLVWPPLYLTVETVGRMMASTSRACSIEGCSGPGGWGAVLELVLTVGVPLWVTIVWVRWRRRRRAASIGGSS